ncbi:hypothetical protein, partial [Umezakia ovalisporum]|uniref:hypothetical protein n=1 Tax=Umezakia ovalisporum TaxID=75695 RepID=UPI0039C735F7
SFTQELIQKARHTRPRPSDPIAPSNQPKIRHLWSKNRYTNVPDDLRSTIRHFIGPHIDSVYQCHMEGRRTA